MVTIREVLISRSTMSSQYSAILNRVLCDHDHLSGTREPRLANPPIRKSVTILRQGADKITTVIEGRSKRGCAVGGRAVDPAASGRDRSLPKSEAPGRILEKRGLWSIINPSH
jgi:hypothetical protein